MKAKIISCNVARPANLDNHGKPVRTGIFKEPVDGPIHLEQLGVRGDIIANLMVHGGPSKAAYIYPAEHYPWWAEKLGGDALPWGTLGENITIENADEAVNERTVHIGDRFRAGTALLEVTKPRLPCFKLGLKLGTNQALRWMVERRAWGFYVAVIEPGEVRAGDMIERISTQPGKPNVCDDGVRRSDE